MTETVSSYEAKTHLPALLRRVEAGERITITRHGKKIATLNPSDDAQLERTQQAVAALRARWEKGVAAKKKPRKWISRKELHEGHKY